MLAKKAGAKVCHAVGKPELTYPVSFHAYAHDRLRENIEDPLMR